MKKHIKLWIAVSALFFTVQSVTAKPVVIDITTYGGDYKIPYYAIYIADDSGAFVETLKFYGTQQKYYRDLRTWYRGHRRSGEDIDALTGASITNGEGVRLRTDIKDEYFNEGYSIIIETASEQGDAYKRDVEVEIEDSNNDVRRRGKGFVKNFYIKW